MNRKRKYDSFCNNSQIITHNPNSIISRIAYENKKLKIDVQYLKYTIDDLVKQIQNLTLEVKKVKNIQNKYLGKEDKEDKIPDELQMFYYA